MSIPNSKGATDGATNSGLAIRTGPGRVVSANRAKIKREDAARDAADRAASEEETRMDTVNRSTPPPAPISIGNNDVNVPEA